MFCCKADADGGFIITSQGVAASLTINGVVFTVPGLSNFKFATLQLRFNSIQTPVQETFSVYIDNADVMVEVDRPAGPFIEVSVEGLTVKIASITVTGDFLFSQKTAPVGVVTKIGIANFSHLPGALDLAALPRTLAVYAACLLAVVAVRRLRIPHIA